jgi:hypothetical protein
VFIPDPGSKSRIFSISHPGSRGQKRTGSPIRIRHTTYKTTLNFLNDKILGRKRIFKNIFAYYVRYCTCVNVDLLCYDFRYDSRSLLISVQSYLKSNQEFYRCKTASYECVRTQKLKQAETGRNGIQNRILIARIRIESSAKYGCPKNAINQDVFYSNHPRMTNM